MVAMLLAASNVVGLLVSPSAPVSRDAGHAVRRSTQLQMGVGDRRIVVTGMGIVSCLGNTLEEVSDSLHAAKPGIKFSEKYKEIGMKSHICGTPDINCDDFIDRKQARFMGINAKYAFIAMQQAVADSGMTPEQMASPRVGGILGQGGTSIADIQDTLNAVDDGKLRRVGPYRVTRSMGSTVSAVLSTAFKLQGVSYSISSACSTGAHCIGVGMEQIHLGKSDVAFCGSGEAEDWGFSVMFDSMGALSTKYNDAPETASRAFDKTRDGFVIAGGLFSYTHYICL
jgi:3-oxoacyl-(acyl-carrier-protein) synthase